MSKLNPNKLVANLNFDTLYFDTLSDYAAYWPREGGYGRALFSYEAMGWLVWNNKHEYIIIATPDQCPPIKLLWLFGYRTEDDNA